MNRAAVQLILSRADSLFPQLKPTARHAQGYWVRRNRCMSIHLDGRSSLPGSWRKIAALRPTPKTVSRACAERPAMILTAGLISRFTDRRSGRWLIFDRIASDWCGHSQFVWRRRCLRSSPTAWFVEWTARLRCYQMEVDERTQSIGPTSS